MNLEIHKYQWRVGPYGYGAYTLCSREWISIVAAYPAGYRWCMVTCARCRYYQPASRRAPYAGGIAQVERHDDHLVTGLEQGNITAVLEKLVSEMSALRQELGALRKDMHDRWKREHYSGEWVF